MNRYSLLLIFLLCCGSCFSQNRFEIDGGIGQPPSYTPFPDFSGGPVVVQSGRKAPSFVFSWLRNVGSHIYIGSKLTFNTYDFTYTSSWSSDSWSVTPDSSGSTTVACKNTYMGIAPTFDVGIGKRHEYVHFFLMPAISFLLNGTMSTEVYQNYAHTPLYHNIQNTSGYLKPILFHLDLGLVEHLPVNKEWHITLTETLSMMARNSTIADAKGTNGLAIMPNYLSLQLGIMHKYHSRKFYERQK